MLNTLTKKLKKNILITIILLSSMFSFNSFSNADIDDSLGSFTNTVPYGGHFVSVLENGTVYDYKYSPDGKFLTYKIILGGTDVATVKPTIMSVKPGSFLVTWYRAKEQETVIQFLNFSLLKTDNIYQRIDNFGNRQITKLSGIISPKF